MRVAASCVYLGAKLEEWQGKVREIVNGWDWLVQRDEWMARRARRRGGGGCPWTRDGSIADATTDTTKNDDDDDEFKYRPHSYQSSTFFDFKDSLIIHEMQILKRLGFQMQVQLPYSTLVNYLNILGVGQDQKVVQMCWSFCSDM